MYINIYFPACHQKFNSPGFVSGSTICDCNCKYKGKVTLFFVTFCVGLPRPLPDVKVLDVDVLVGCSLPLAPQQEAFFSRSLCGCGEEIIVKLEKISGFYFDSELIPV